MSKSPPALVFNGLAAVVVLFQLALALGAPWGELTWGGQFPGTLPAAMRLVCFLSASLLGVFALVVSVRAGLLLPRWQRTARKLVWVVVAYAAVGVVANALTPSEWERLLWLPVAIMLFVSSFAVARA